MGEEGDASSDIYSLGLLMWELITTEIPFGELGIVLITEEKLKKYIVITVIM
jgi:serine/threonine protein kinase